MFNKSYKVKRDRRWEIEKQKTWNKMTDLSPNLLIGYLKNKDFKYINKI